MNKNFLFFLLIFLVINQNNFAEDLPEDTIMVAFWNLENLFDTFDNPDKDDEEFLPGAEKQWDEEKLDKKLYNLSRVIRAMNNGNGPDILGVCEVEHQHLLDTLISRYLSEKNYKSVHAESPDKRGIDNGLIFNNEKFSFISCDVDTVITKDKYPTRLILNVKLLSKTDDTISVYVNHWPSRRGGDESVTDRFSAAETLKKNIENSGKNNIIFIIGDFNDEPVDSSITIGLNAYPFICEKNSENIEINNKDFSLLNLAYHAYSEDLGTYKYRDNWNLLDQIIVSSDILSNNKIKYICDSFEVFKPEFMVTRSGQYEGTPFPTFGGRRYLGGYSDHFPVTAKFILKNE